MTTSLYQVYDRQTGKLLGKPLSSLPQSESPGPRLWCLPLWQAPRRSLTPESQPLYIRKKIMKAYTAKSSAVRAAKAAFGTAWESKAAVLPATAEQGAGWVVIPRAPEPVIATDSKADAKANRLALGWVLSTAVKPTKKVWEIASSMPEASRKEVIAACVAAGIAPGTARTQYQAFFSARKSDQTRSASK